MHEREILERLDFIMSALTDLAAATAANTTAVNAAVAALAADATGSDSAAIEAAVTQLTTNNNALTAAVAPTSGAGPVVTAVSPVAVAVAGGTPVTISGSGFTDAQVASFCGALEQDADLVAFIHREAYYKRNDPTLEGKATVIIAKQRQGRVGPVRLRWAAEQTFYFDESDTGGALPPA